MRRPTRSSRARRRHHPRSERLEGHPGFGQAAAAPPGSARRPDPRRDRSGSRAPRPAGRGGTRLPGGQRRGPAARGGHVPLLVALRDAATPPASGSPARRPITATRSAALYAGEQTEIAAVRLAVEWARTLRAMINGTEAPLTPQPRSRRPTARFPTPSSRPPLRRGSAVATPCWRPSTLAGGGSPKAELDDSDDASGPDRRPA